MLEQIKVEYSRKVKHNPKKTFQNKNFLRSSVSNVRKRSVLGFITFDYDFHENTHSGLTFEGFHKTAYIFSFL